MRQRPPATILEFLRGLGIGLSLNLYGRVNELYPKEWTCLAPFVRSALPAIKAELERERLLSAKPKKPVALNAIRLPPPGPRLNQVRVTNFFRGMNRIEVFQATEAQWIELGWVRRQRDGRKIAAQKLLALSAGAEPAAEKGISSKE